MAIFIKIKNQQQILQRLKSENEVEPQTPKKTSHKQTSASEGKQYTLVFNLLAAMVIAQTSVQQQHINPSWPSILTCDKRGGREGGGGGPPPLRHAALSSTRAPAGPREPTVIRRALFLEMQGVEGAGGGTRKSKGGRGALSMKDNVWSRLKTYGHRVKRRSREKWCFQSNGQASQLVLRFLFVFHSSKER